MRSFRVSITPQRVTPFDKTQHVDCSTGMKCIGVAKVVIAKGNILHDSHAETLALRAFNRFLLDECQRLTLAKGAVSTIIRQRVDFESSPTSRLKQFTVCEDVRIFMYCSEAPCGDASMELVMQAQKDATPWPVTQRLVDDDDDDEFKSYLLGRGSFSQLGIVRRKPGRLLIS